MAARGGRGSKLKIPKVEYVQFGRFVRSIVLN